MLFCEEELLLPELDAELWLLPELEAPLLELDEPLPLLLGAEKLGADELFELPEPLPELEGALELLLGPDELLELDELLLELEELLETEELLLDPDEPGGLLSELEELLDSEFSLIGFFLCSVLPRSPLPKQAHRNEFDGLDCFAADRRESSFLHHLFAICLLFPRNG